MEVALSEQFTAPVLLGKQWWNSLVTYQKLFLTIVIFQFSLGATLSYVSLCVDQIYSIKVVVTKVELHKGMPKPIAATGVLAHRGYWSRSLHNITNLKEHEQGLIEEKLIHNGHFNITTELINFCFDKSPRLSPLLNLASFFILLTTGVSLFFLAFLVLFRVQFLLAVPLTLMTDCMSLLLVKLASIEQLNCLNELPELWGRKSAGVWLLRSRVFESSLNFDGPSIKINALTAIIFYLPAAVLAYLLVFVNRKHL